MDIRCPKCDFSRHVPDEAISSDMTMATCPKCGERFRFTEAPSSTKKREEHSGLQTETNSSVSHDTHTLSDPKEILHTENDFITQEEDDFVLPPDTPWGMIREMGFFPAFSTTVKAVMFAPRHLFGAMRKDGPFAMPFTFYLLASMIGILFETIWQKTLGNPLLPEPLNGSTMTLEDFLITIMFSPVALTVYLYLIGGLIHICLMLTGGNKGGLGTTLRVICYSSALDILGVIPYFGSLIGGLWKLYILAVGLRSAHNASKAQITPAMLLLVLLLLVMAGMMLKGMGVI